MAQEAPHIADDISRGVGLIHLKLRLQLQSIVRVVLIAAIGLVSAPLLLLWLRAEPNAVTGAVWWWVADGLRDMGAGEHVLHPLGDPRSWTANAILANTWFTTQARAIQHLFWLGATCGLVGAPLLAVLVILVARAIGKGARQPHLLRGRSLVPDRELADMLLRSGNASDLAIGQVPLADAKETQHIMMAGTVGAGKTQAMYRLLDTVRARGDIAIVYDIAGAFVPIYYQPELGDQILNPLDKRSAVWSPWAEMVNPASADRIAAAIIPSQEGPNRFFSDAARALFSAGLRLMHTVSNRTMFELFHLLTVAAREQKERRFADTEVAKFYEKDAARTGAAIDITAANYIRALRFLKADAGRDDFSVSQFVRTADAAIGSTAPRPWLFITSRRGEHDALRPLITCLLDSAIAAALSLPENRQRRIWLFVDEIDSLNQMPSLIPALQEGRKYGVCVVAGVQDFTQLVDVWGKERGEAMLSMFNTAAIFRMNSVFSADYASKMLGEAERERTEESARYGAHTGFESLNLGTRRDVERLVLSTEIMKLPDLSCFIRLPGDFPIAKTTLPNPAKTIRPLRHLAFEEADLSDSVQSRLAGTDNRPNAATQAGPTDELTVRQVSTTATASGADGEAADKEDYEHGATLAPEVDNLEATPI